MKAWPDQKIIRLLGIEIPILQAPMAGIDTPALAVAVTNAGGLGSLACALLSPDQIRDAWSVIKKSTSQSINLNFFCHQHHSKSASQQERWKNRLATYYTHFCIDPDKVADTPLRMPFDENLCEVVEDLKPAVVSFHFGLPSKPLLQRVKKTGAIILSSATTLEEAIWLEQNGCDAIIAQGVEAGGHRGMFLTNDITTQTNTLSLVSQIIKAVSIPVIAAGGIADASGIQASFECGASAVQLGTAYMFCPEAKVSPLYRQTLETDSPTTLTNVLSGHPARGIINRFINEVGPISPDAPEFPYASHFVTPLRNMSEKSGSIDFMQMWSGQIRKPHRMTASELTKTLCKQTLESMMSKDIQS